MIYTPNYNLKKPGTDDLVDVDDLNDNADIIDGALAAKQDELTAGAGIDITNGVISATGIVEKVLELPLDWEVAGASNGLYTSSGSEIFLSGDQTGTGGLLHNARITGIEVEVAQGVWYNAFAVIPTGVIPVILTMPVAVTLDGDDYTIILVTPAAVSQLEDALTVRIHYIALDGITTVTT